MILWCFDYPCFWPSFAGGLLNNIYMAIQKFDFHLWLISFVSMIQLLKVFTSADCVLIGQGRCIWLCNAFPISVFAVPVVPFQSRWHATTTSKHTVCWGITPHTCCNVSIAGAVTSLIEFVHCQTTASVQKLSSTAFGRTAALLCDFYDLLISYVSAVIFT